MEKLTQLEMSSETPSPASIKMKKLTHYKAEGVQGREGRECSANACSMPELVDYADWELRH